MGSDEAAITIPGALEKLTFLPGTGRHRVHKTLVVAVDRLLEASRGRSGSG